MSRACVRNGPRTAWAAVAASVSPPSPHSNPNIYQTILCALVRHDYSISIACTEHGN